ncbi:hypothetical protein [Flavobacterium subsaxonicum]|uniref:Lipoprotein n=1 Tax=Flavobacterium subsaxonicum WB 4.1-42 = DSM 21790 TaxID=1121898 RepID=A0A0A2MRJ0_9FLAO|nr:hypothetical protein [Flavobacterium subsaxonicum]KGO94156.1 hypothetical protein Q766_04285 [Flavobacterium subsaxonicum WB 4.1-42 = DSM 21790]
MKSKFVFVFFVLLLIACKKEAPAGHSGKYPEIVVATANGDAFAVANDSIIKPEWEKVLNKNSTGKTIMVLEVVKGKTEGGAKDFYMLIAKCNDGQTSIAALLEKQGNELYFDKSNPQTIICSGNCSGGCLPVAKNDETGTYLVCSACDNCTKTEHSLNFSGHSNN